MRDRPPSARQRLRAAENAGEAIAISSIVLFELWYGAARGRYQQQNLERLEAFLAGGVNVLAFEPADAEIAGDLRAHLESLGTPVGPYDLLIAAHAVRHGLTLVTDNAAEFARVPGLTSQSWSSSTDAERT